MYLKKEKKKRKKITKNIEKVHLLDRILYWKKTPKLSLDAKSSFGVNLFNKFCGVTSFSTGIESGKSIKEVCVLFPRQYFNTLRHLLSTCTIIG